MTHTRSKEPFFRMTHKCCVWVKGLLDRNWQGNWPRSGWATGLTRRAQVRTKSGTSPSTRRSSADRQKRVLEETKGDESRHRVVTVEGWREGVMASIDSSFRVCQNLYEDSEYHRFDLRRRRYEFAEGKLKRSCIVVVEAGWRWTSRETERRIGTTAWNLVKL